MANDALVDVRVIRAIDSNGNVHNVACDSNGNISTAASGSATAGVPTTTADQAVAGVDVTVLAANTSRKEALIVNTGSANIRVNIGAAATSTTGIQLMPGANLRITGGPNYGCPTGAVHAIRESGVSSNASVTEIQ